MATQSPTDVFDGTSSHGLKDPAVINISTTQAVNLLQAGGGVFKGRALEPAPSPLEV